MTKDGGSYRAGCLNAKIARTAPATKEVTKAKANAPKKKKTFGIKLTYPANGWRKKIWVTFRWYATKRGRDDALTAEFKTRNHGFKTDYSHLDPTAEAVEA